MNRTRLSESLTTTEDLASDVVVATSFPHPDRGPTVCPAAPLLHAWLERNGIRSVLAPLRQPLSTGRDPVAVHVTSYLDTDGSAVGLAVAAREPHTSAANRCVELWSAAIRTRRVIVPEQHRPGTSIPHPRHEECAKARSTRAVVKTFLERGDSVLLLGPSGAHEAGAPIEGCVEIPGPAELDKIDPLLDPARLLFAIRPCAPIEDVTPLLRILRDRFPLLRGQHPDHWCYATSDRRDSMRLAAREADLLVLLGTPDVPEHVYGTAPVQRVRTLADLLPQHLLRASTVAVGTDDSPALGLDVLVGVLSGLGPLSVIEHRVTSRVLTTRALLASLRT